MSATQSRAVYNTLQLLEALGRGENSLSLAELSRACAIPKATALRYLTTLVQESYATRDLRTGGYRLGARVFELSRRFYDQSETLGTAREHMRELAESTNETAHLAVLQPPHVVYIDVADSPQRVRAFVSRGERLPAHCVAAGRAILAHSPPAVVKDLIAHGLDKLTSKTITDRDEFLAEIARVARRGYSAVRGEWRPEVFGISAPLFSLDGEVVGAIGVSCPMARIGQDIVKRLGELVSATAQRISQGTHASASTTRRIAR